MKRGLVKWKILLWSFLIVYLTAAIGSLFTDVGPWYDSVRPSITPPNWVFPIVWNILFFIIALSLYFVWKSAEKDEKWIIALAYGENLILNMLWSLIYFGFRNPKFALHEILLLWTSIMVMIYYSYKIDRKAAYLLIPYLLWVSFAIILNYLSI